MTPERGTAIALNTSVNNQSLLEWVHVLLLHLMTPVLIVLLFSTGLLLLLKGFGRGGYSGCASPRPRPTVPAPPEDASSATPPADPSLAKATRKRNRNRDALAGATQRLMSAGGGSETLSFKYHEAELSHTVEQLLADADRLGCLLEVSAATSGQTRLVVTKEEAPESSIRFAMDQARTDDGACRSLGLREPRR